MSLDIGLNDAAHRETVRAVFIAWTGAFFGGVLIGIADSTFSPTALVGISIGTVASYLALAYLPSAERVAIEWREHEELYDDGGQR